MTSKIYKTAQGKTVDMGSLLLQNETVRAVGNMNVNARGDLIDSSNQVIDQKNRQVQRQMNRQTNVSTSPVTSSTSAAKKAKAQAQAQLETLEEDTFNELLSDESLAEQVDLDQPATTDSRVGGLAAAIARTREVKQELEKTAKQKAQEQTLKRI
jgi:hypothetical protein